MKSIKTLHLVNFQSHLDTVIDLHPGLNIFIGESDQGKTAIIRALRWLVYNEPRGTGFIRVGETRCEVTAILSDDTKVTRLRDETKRQNRYVIIYPNGEELVLEKFKNEVPLEVQQVLEVYPLWIDTDQKRELNLAGQLDSPFLIAESPANRAKVIGRIANLHIIDAAQRELLRDIRSQGRVKANLENDIAQLETDREQYEDLPQKQELLQVIKLKIDTYEQTKTKITQLDKLLKRQTQLAEEINRNKIQLAQLQNLDTIITLYEKTVATNNYFLLLNQINNKHEAISHELNQHLTTINQLVKLDEAIAVYRKSLKAHNLYHELQNLEAKLKGNSNKLPVFNNLITATNDLPKAEQIISQLYNLRQTGYKLQQKMMISRQLKSDITTKQKQLNEADTILSHLQDINQGEDIITRQKYHLEKLIKMESLNQQSNKTKQMIRAKNQEIDKLNNGFQETQQKFIKLLEEAGTCPTCGSTITAQVTRSIIIKELKVEGELS